MLCSLHITALSCTTVHIVHIWNCLPDVAKSSTTLAQFRARLNSIKFTGCQCTNCIRFYPFLHFYSRLNGVEFAGCQFMNFISQLKSLMLGLTSLRDILYFILNLS